MTAKTETEALALFEASLDQPSDTRLDWVRSQTEDTPDIRARVLALLAADTSSASGIRTGGASGDLESIIAPERIGAYRIEGLIGEGGMGAVFRGSRDKGDFEHDVAIKIIRPGALSELLQERFFRERRLLAQLNHPNIAKLFDGGETETGAPYMIMEYVEGLPVLESADARNLSTRARISLFIQICSAVRHAHQNLIIHRDITPTNVLVTSDGSPKLIDFGIAREEELETSEVNPSLTSSMSYTPGYAAPERQTGAAATTLSDIFSLGRLLRDLIGKDSPDAELQAIVARASALDPLRRYASVDALIDDLQNWQNQRPVAAMNGGSGYRFGKYLKRRKGIVAATAAAFLALSGALGLTLVQYNRAETARQVADKRFEDVRELAGTVLYDVHDKIARIPGSTEARQLIAEAATKYMDELAATPNAPIDLRLETANGYTALGQIYGSPKGQSLQDWERGKANYAKAAPIYEGILAEDPDNLEALLSAGKHYFYAAETAVNPDADHPRALDLLATSEAHLAHLLTLTPDDEDAQLSMMFTRAARADIFIRENKLAEAAALLETADSEIARLIRLRADRGEAPTEDQLRFQNANWRILGQIYTYQSRLDEALEVLTRAVDAYPAIEAFNPDDAFTIRGRAMVHWRRGFANLQSGNTDAAIADYNQAIASGNRLVARDPADAGALSLLASFNGELGSALSAAGRYDEAEAYLLETAEYYYGQYEAAPDNPAAQRSVLVQNYQFAMHYKAAGNVPKTCAALAEVFRFADLMTASGNMQQADADAIAGLKPEFPEC